MSKKKALMGIMTALLIASMGVVTAIEVDCGKRWDAAICSEWELQDEFDEVTTMINDTQNAVETQAGITNKQGKKIQKNKKNIKNNKEEHENLESYVASNQQTWAEDRGGWNRNGVKEYLYGAFLNFLKKMFVTQEELALHIAEDKGLNDEHECYAAMYLANKYNETRSVEGHVARPGSDYCVKIVG